ncbi:MAG TPA: serine hydrolase domain-containing protein [Chitinophagaceae bacterium]|nr:serine hydrolase domain-containing protein [Chitinophagaceae bacterium]
MKNNILFFTLLFFHNLLPAQTISKQIDSVVDYCSRHFSFEGVVLVTDNRKKVYSRAVGYANREWNIKNSADVKFRLGSISKQFAGYILFTLVQEGKLNWEDKVCQWLPQLCGEEKRNITISDLIHHTSGLSNYTGLANFNEQEFYPKDSIIQIISKAPLVFPPGSRFSYSNSNFYLAGILAEKASGTLYDSLLLHRAFIPAGMHHSGLDHEGLVLQNRATGYIHEDGKVSNAGYLNVENPFSAGAMYSTANDLWRWLIFFQKQLAANTKLQQLLRTSMAGKDTNMYAAGWCNLNNQFFHTGHINGFANIISMDTLHHRSVIILSNTEFKQLYVLRETIVSILDRKKNVLKWMTEKIPAKEMDQYTETFKRAGTELVIKNENGRLKGSIRNRPMEFFHFDKDRFFNSALDGIITFERNKNNEIAGIKTFQSYAYQRYEKLK